MYAYACKLSESNLNLCMTESPSTTLILLCTRLSVACQLGCQLVKAAERDEDSH